MKNSILLSVLSFFIVVANAQAQYQFTYGFYDFYTDNNAFNDDDVEKLCIRSNNDYWFRSDNQIGYYRVENDQFNHLSILNTYQNAGNGIWIDNEENILFHEFESLGGGNKAPNRLGKISYTDSLNFTLTYLDSFPRQINSIDSDSSNLYWITMETAWNDPDSISGIYSYDESQLVAFPLSYNNTNIFFPISSARTSNINKFEYLYILGWYGDWPNYEHGLIKFNTNNGNYSVFSENSLGFNLLEINDMVSDTLGNIWFTTLNGKLIKFDHSSETITDTYSAGNPFENLGVYTNITLSIDRSNRVWAAYSDVSSNSGYCHLYVYWFDGTWHEYFYHDYSSCGFQRLNIDENGRKMHGISDGLQIWEDSLSNSGSYRPFKSYDNLTANVKEISENDVITVFPNPASNKFTISSNTKGQVTASSIEGKVVYNSRIDPGQNIVSTRNWSSGTYVLKIRSNKKITQSIIVIE